jgi:acyl-coenzyme A thioesterase PaaI-like protein
MKNRGVMESETKRDKTSEPLQDLIGPNAPIRNCFGCGTDNAHGMKIKSRLVGDEGVAVWQPQSYHCSYPGFLNGGVAGTLIDCHSAWTAYALECRERGVDVASAKDVPTGWTKSLKLEFLKPTPLDGELTLRAVLEKKGNTSRTVRCSIWAKDQECVRGEVVMIMK